MDGHAKSISDVLLNTNALQFYELSSSERGCSFTELYASIIHGVSILEQVFFIFYSLLL